MASNPLSRQERLNEYFRRLAAQPPSQTADEAFERIIRTLDEVEDELSGIPKRYPPPPMNMPDGRMYPPQPDRIVRQPDGSIIAKTRRHEILVAPDGRITVKNAMTGIAEFDQPGAGN